MPEVEEVHHLGQVVHLDLLVPEVGHEDLPGPGDLHLAELDRVAEDDFEFLDGEVVFLEEPVDFGEDLLRVRVGSRIEVGIAEEDCRFGLFQFQFIVCGLNV